VTFSPKDLFAKIPGMLLGGGMGAAATIVYVLADKEPKALIDTVQHLGASAFLGTIALVLASKGASRVLDIGEQMLQVGRDNAASQQRLADAVNSIASKDDAEAYEQRVLIGHIGTQTEKILTRFDDFEKRINQQDRDRDRARGANA
jgi:hypothetical protein